MDTKQFIEWALVFVIILALIYTAYIIKNEKSFGRKFSKKIKFCGFQFKIPPWWSKKSEKERELIFYRADTRYDWEAKFIFGPVNMASGAPDLFKLFLEERRIVFDKENSGFHFPLSLFEDNDTFTNGPYEVLRIEGTATQNQEDRIYYDAFLFLNKDESSFHYLESKSSVLNGLVEGPFFEDLVAGIEVTKFSLYPYK